MKTKIIIIILLSSFLLHAQSPITVTITGCGGMSHTYEFNGVVNTKNSYIYIVDPTGVNIPLSIYFNSTEWVMTADLQLLFFNENIPEGVLPPNTGWVSEGCGVDGTLIIEGGVNLSNEYFETDEFLIFPNPVIEELNINAFNTEKTYNIFDMQGRILKNGKAFSKIDVSNLKEGVYLLVIDSHVHKFVKRTP